MASEFEKAPYQAPLGLPEEDIDELGAEIDLEAPESEITMLEDGGAEIQFGDDEYASEELPFDANLAEHLSEDELVDIATTLVGEVESDQESRSEWADAYVEGLDVLGFDYEKRTEPWENACGVYSTVLAEAAIRFQAEAMSETFPPQGPVKTKIIGEETKEKTEAAERVRMDMNYEITEGMTEYRPEHERLLYSLGLAGSGFKKVYFDPNLDRQTALYVPAEDVIVPYGASHISTAERVTHVMRKTKNDMAKLQNAGFYIDDDLGEPVPYHNDVEEKKAKDGGFSLTDDNRYCLYEIHVDYVLPGDWDEDLDEDGMPKRIQLAKPYVITIDFGTKKVLAIRRNWDLEDELKLKRQHFVHYTYVPGFGFYGLGLIHIIGGYAKAGTSLIRQLVDSGTLSNLPGGLKTKGLRLKGDDAPIGPGEWKDVDVPSGALRDNIMPLPYKEPSMVLLTLLERITEEGRRLGAISDMNISDMSANAPVGTTLALLERTLKPMAAVQARVHYSMKQEFKLIRTIIAEHAPEEYEYDVGRGEERAKQADYAMVEVIPVSDPNSSTMAQRIVQYQAVDQLSKGAPQIYDLPYLHRQMVEVLGVPNADKIIPLSEDALPLDPVSENMGVLVGKPIKASINQDHAAHMAAHQAFMQDPMVAQTIGQNPMANQIMSSMQAHIAEHLAFNYRKQIEEKLGAPLPPHGSELDEEVENTLSQVLATAAIQLTQSHQEQAAQQKAQQEAEDPVMKLRLEEQQVKKQEADTKDKEVNRKIAKDEKDDTFQNKELRVESTIKAAEMEQASEEAEVTRDFNSAKLVVDSLTKANSKPKEAPKPPKAPEE